MVFSCFSKPNNKSKKYKSLEDPEQIHLRLKNIIYKAKDPNRESHLDHMPFKKPRAPITKNDGQFSQQHDSSTSSCLPINETIIDPKNDRRNRFENTNQWPNSAIGLLEIQFYNEKFIATGTVIGPLIVLTAAHNIYDPKLKQGAVSIHFIPGKSDKNCPFGIHEAEKWYFPDEFKTNADEDYAVIFLKPNPRWNPLGNYTGMFGIRCLEPEDSGKKLSIKGYPGDKAAEGGHQLWGMTTIPDSFSINSSDVFEHTIDAFGGQSGSALLIEDEQTIIGVHVRGRNHINEATLINERRLEKIQQWIMIHYIPTTDNVINLDLSNMNLGSKGMEFLSSFSLPELQTLMLDNNNIGPEGAKLLCKIQCPNLAKLSLRKNNIGPQGATKLNYSAFSKLKSLDLYKNDISDKGIKKLSQTYFPNLDWLNLEINNIGKQGAQYLSAAKDNFPNLKSLYIGSNYNTQLSVQIIKKAFPNVDIQ